MLIGTLSYMSPEQVTGSAVDGRSDIFAVGTVLYELLCGRQAFPGRLDTGVLHKILNTAPEPLEDACPNLDSEIVQIVMRALEKDPAARYQDLTTMRRDVLRVLRRLEADDVQPSPDDETILMATPSPSAPSGPIAEPRLPTPTPRTPKGTDREALERRRATQIQTLLDAADKALDGGDYDAVIARCEEVLLIDSDSSRAWDLRDRAKAALDERQGNAWLDEAQQKLDRGDLDTAAELAQRALEVNAASLRAPSLLRRVDDARQERLREQERVQRCRAAVDRARNRFDEGQFEEAVVAAEQALAIDPDRTRRALGQAQGARSGCGRGQTPRARGPAREGRARRGRSSRPFRRRRRGADTAGRLRSAARRRCGGARRAALGNRRPTPRRGPPPRRGAARRSGTTGTPATHGRGDRARHRRAPQPELHGGAGDPARGREQRPGRTEPAGADRRRRRAESGGRASPADRDRRATASRRRV